MNEKQKALIEKAYFNFNNRDIDGVLETMSPDVHWPNGWEGGYVTGFDAVRDYWTRQWKELDPNVIPVAFEALNENAVKVTVRQLVKALSGAVLFDGHINHIYTFEGGLIKGMEIEKIVE